MSFLKNSFYMGMKGLFRSFTPFYFSSVRVFGRENIPKSGGVVFSPNHQGAFLDPILVGAYVPGKLFSLTRGDVFVWPYKWAFEAMQMLPVYRIRNGFSSLKNNDATFAKCHEILGRSQNIMMFSEGLHHKEMYLYPVSKGSSRLVFKAQQKHPKTPLFLVPVGINYQDYNRPRKGLQLVFGKAIPIQPFLKQAEKEVHIINSIRESLTEGMKACLWIPEKEDHYESKVAFINKVDCRQSFADIKQEVSEITNHRHSKTSSKAIRLWYQLLRFPNCIPLWLTKKLMQQFKDPIFHGSVKYAAALFLFPLWYCVLGVSLFGFYGMTTALSVVFGLLLFLLISMTIDDRIN